MKFKTIVLTKNKLMIATAVILAAAAAAVAAHFLPRDEEVTDVFAMGGTYEEILGESLPSSNAEKGGWGKIVSKITGIDVQDPKSVINEYSAAFEGTTPKADYAPENGFSADIKVDRNTADEHEAPPLPTHEQICSSVGLKMNNATHYSVDINSMCAEELKIKPDSDLPQVLVVHTHTTECYNGDEMSGETERNTDENVNVIAVGNEICAVLESYGIKTIHDTTYHDYPSYQGSYTRALSTIDRILKENPSVKAVLDIHRDAFVYSDGSRLRVACELDGVSTAQVMIVAGTNSMGLWHENWRDNLTFAAKIQNSAEIMYPGLMRPVNLRTERFNQHMTRGSLILEVGSNGNTLDEAKEGGRDVARAIAAALING